MSQTLTLVTLTEKWLSFPKLPSMKKIIINRRHSMLAEFSAGLSYTQFNGLYWISKVFRCLFLYEVNSHVVLETIWCLIRLRTILLGMRREQLRHHSMYNTPGQFTQPESSLLSKSLPRRDRFWLCRLLWVMAYWSLHPSLLMKKLLYRRKIGVLTTERKAFQICNMCRAVKWLQIDLWTIRLSLYTQQHFLCTTILAE